MRRISGIATAAVLALTTVGITTAGGTAAGSATPFGDSSGTTYRITDTITDSDGSTHVRMERSYQGLPVLGGDLVVHRAPSGAQQGVSETLDHVAAVSTTPAVTGAA